MTTYDNIDIEVEIKLKYHYLGIEEDDEYSNDFSFDNIISIYVIELREGSIEKLTKKREKQKTLDNESFEQDY